MMTVDERALVFECGGESLVGILSGAGLAAARGILIVVGGPQYRAGSHRQFTLLARYIAERGIPALRFDCRGMGDSEGEARTFERIGEDIRCAIDRFFASVPSLKDVVIWGLCDAASAALFYAYQDMRVSGLILLNPWVRTEQGVARARLRHYYARRLFQASLWQKLARGEFHLREAAVALGRFLIGAMWHRRSLDTIDGSLPTEVPLPDRMEDGLRKFRGRVLVILSGNDLTAQEFEGVVENSPRWRKVLEDKRVTQYRIAEANHTFARRDWRDQVARWTEVWVKSF